jgi:flagellin-like hook-associated protein FlgL
MRIGASLSGFELTLLNRLSRANAAATANHLRLATLEKVNHASDDPSALVALSRLQTESRVASQTAANIAAASSAVSQAQLALDQIRTQLETIRTKAIEDQDGSLTAAERTANQAAIDAAIEQINLLASTDSGGRRLLDGSADFTYTGQNAAQVSRLQVYSLGAAETQTISGTVTTPASRALLTHTEGTGLIASDAVLSLTGERGSASITVTTGESLATVATRINAESHLTGITATVAGNDLRLQSVEYGTDAGVQVEVVSGAFAVAGGAGDGTATGEDAVATVNGYAYTGDGNHFSISQNGFRFDVEITAGYSGALSAVTVSGSALSFAISSDLARTATLSIPGVHAAELGGVSGRLTDLMTGGTLAGLAANSPQAVRVVDEALDRLTLIEGNVDGFATATLDSSAALYSDLGEVLQTAIDDVNAVDEDAEETLLAKNQALAANAVAGLAILNQQRQSIVSLLQHMAGLD